MSFETTVRPKSLALSTMIDVLTARGTLRSLKRLIAFGSTSGHFGGHGQADYSLANQVLARQIARLRHDEPQLRATCIHWHAWDGVGMATRDGIPLILEQFGLKMMPLQEGINHFISEAESGSSPAEVVITEPNLVAASPYGDTLQSAEPQQSSKDSGPPQRQEITLDPSAHPFLDDHRLDGVPLLPAAMAAELIFQMASRSTALIEKSSLIDFEILKAVMVTDGGTTKLDIQYDHGNSSIAMYQDGSPHPSIRAKIAPRDDLLNGLPRPSTCPFPLYPAIYFESSSLRHGVTLRSLKGTYFERNGGWAELLAPDPAAVLGHFYSEEIHTPVALLDGCFYACGLYAYFLCGQRIERPAGFKRLTLWADVKADQPCWLRFALIDQTPDYSLYDIRLFNSAGDILLEVERLRMGRFS